MFDVLSELESKRGLMTPQEVADLFRISKRTVQRLIERRELPTLLIGGQRRIDPAALYRHLKRKNPMLARGREQGPVHEDRRELDLRS
ncbi:MAG TPA: helix-turn-helix domain-containing protein [Acidobacteriaceae bacterium]|nr:helix-turn-helix domain-containing protein [Acidobacteriaceae bacterium]